ncbi:BrnA antitoxin family protein [Ovoidimarina sediminis]|uniref:BrnA antitoxin family protein n=1 Tax=Ovoidimarina sediminis TaxID=3079856 RepID=UPI00397786BA
MPERPHAVPAQSLETPYPIHDGEAVQAKGRGPQKAPTKIAISIRLDRDLVEALRQSGRGWQSRVNAWLRDHLEGTGSPAEEFARHPEEDNGPDHRHDQRAPEG